MRFGDDESPIRSGSPGMTARKVTAKATTDPYGMTNKKAMATAAADPSGMTVSSPAGRLPAMHHHAVLARPFGSIQSLIGQFHQLKPALQRLVHRRHPHADRQRLVLPLLCRHALHHASRQYHGALFAALRQQHNKLLAAIPSRKIRQPHRRSQNRPQTPQHLIARRMSPPVIDRL